MLRRSALALALAFAVVSSPVWADILWLKDGNILELEYVTKKKNAQNKEVVVFKNEKGEKFEFTAKDIKQWAAGKPTWIIRTENLKWYDAEKAKARNTWEAEARFAAECRKRDLDAQALDHFRKSYALRKPLTKDEENDHKKVADWLEKDACLFDESLDEMRVVLACKRKKVADTVQGHCDLARTFCEPEGLMAEAQEEYLAALKIDEKSSSAKSALEKLRRNMEFQLDPAMYKSVRGSMSAAAKALRQMQNQDGSFGANLTVYNINAHRAMTCLAGIALMCHWEFEILAKGDAARDVPKEVAAVLDLILDFKIPPDNTLNGKDIWGCIFEIDLLTRASRRKMLERYHHRIRKRMSGVLKELDGYRKSDGGWMYYEPPICSSSASFPTAAAVLNMLAAKNSGFEVPEDYIGKAVKCLGGLKFAEGSYNYHEDGVKGTAMDPTNSPVGASARSPLSEGAMMAAGQGSEQSLRFAVDYFFRWRPVLQKIKGQGGTHIGKGAVAPYYFLFGHYWMTRVLKLLDRAQQRFWLYQMRAYMLSYKEVDGSFWDWQGMEVPAKVYGTALAMMTLYHIASIEKDFALGQQKLPPHPKLDPKEDKKDAPTPGSQPKDPPKDSPK